MTWLRTRSYRPTAYSTMMHGKDFYQAILVDEPNYITYMVYAHIYTKAPSLPTDQVSETAYQGKWLEYEVNHLEYELHLRTVNMVVEDEEVIEKNRQRSLPCPWEAGQCHAEGHTYIWNVTEPDYCPVAVVTEFLGHGLHANVSNPEGLLDSHQAEAIISSEVGEKIRILPTGPLRQCGQVVTATNIEDMFLFPILETDERGRVLADKRGQVFVEACPQTQYILGTNIKNKNRMK